MNQIGMSIDQIMTNQLNHLLNDLDFLEDGKKFFFLQMSIIDSQWNFELCFKQITQFVCYCRRRSIQIKYFPKQNK